MTQQRHPADIEPVVAMTEPPRLVDLCTHHLASVLAHQALRAVAAAGLATTGSALPLGGLEEDKPPLAAHDDHMDVDAAVQLDAEDADWAQQLVDNAPFLPPEIRHQLLQMLCKWGLICDGTLAALLAHHPGDAAPSTTLNLRGCKLLSPPGLCQLAGALVQGGFKEINLHGAAQLTDATVVHLVEALGATLEGVKLSKCSLLTSASVGAIATQLPRLTSINIAGGCVRGCWWHGSEGGAWGLLCSGAAWGRSAGPHPV